MYDRIVIPTDGSDAAAAAEVAVGVASRADAAESASGAGVDATPAGSETVD